VKPPQKLTTLKHRYVYLPILPNIVLIVVKIAAKAAKAAKTARDAEPEAHHTEAQVKFSQIKVPSLIMLISVKDSCKSC